MTVSKLRIYVYSPNTQRRFSQKLKHSADKYGKVSLYGAAICKLQIAN